MPAIFFFLEKRGVKYVLFYRVITRMPGTYFTAPVFLRRDILDVSDFFIKTLMMGPAIFFNDRSTY
jgi:hypothetical protein